MTLLAPHRPARLVAVAIPFILAVALCSPVPACAQAVNPKSAAMAEALFREGRAAMERGDLEHACPKLKESLRLDPAIGTRWHLARCYEDSGRTASAWALFNEVAAEARRLDRPRQERAAQKRAAALEPHLCRMRLTIDGDSTDVEVILDDDEKLGPGAFGAAVPVDCGRHRVTVRRGSDESETEVVVDQPGEVVSVSAPVPVHQVVTPAVPPPPPPEGPAWYRDVVGWCLVGGGAALAGVSPVLLRQSVREQDRARAAGLDLAVRDRHFDKADRYRGGAIAAGVAGAGLIAAGVVKLAMHEPEAGAAVTPTDDGATAMLWFRF